MLSQSIVTSLSSGEGPDVFYLPSTMTLGKAVEEHMVVPVSDYIEAEWFETLIDEVFIDGITMIGDEMCIRDRSMTGRMLSERFPAEALTPSSGCLNPLWIWRSKRR